LIFQSYLIAKYSWFGYKKLPQEIINQKAIEIVNMVSNKSQGNLAEMIEEFDSLVKC
jgi:hypothetical protein